MTDKERMELLDIRNELVEMRNRVANAKAELIFVSDMLKLYQTYTQKLEKLFLKSIRENGSCVFYMRQLSKLKDELSAGLKKLS